MRRAVLRDVKTLAFEEVNRPACPEDGLLVKMKTCSVCATDVKIYNHGHQLLQLPRVLGHEIAGIVAETGPRAAGGFAPGQRVAVCAVINCGRCDYCLRGAPSMCLDLEAFGYHYDGGYEEYLAVPAKSIQCGGVNVLPETMSFQEASLAELLACSINGQNLSGFQLGQSVLIIGVGPVGLMQAQLARARGVSCVWVADVLAEKRALAEALLGDGVAGTLDTADEGAFLDAVQAVTDGRGFDQVMLCCGVGSIQRVSLACVAKMGCVNFFGGLPKGNSLVELDTNLIHYKQCRVVGTHGSSALENREALAMIHAGLIDVKPLVTETIPLDALEDALRVTRPAPSRLKSVVTFE